MKAETEGAQPRELFGHLLPLGDGALLLPKPAVLEVRGMDDVALETSGPDWFLGTADWDSRQLPVISMEVLSGQSPPARTQRSRLAVINSFGSHLKNGLFMVVIQGYPHLTALIPDIFKPLPVAPEDEGVILSRARVANIEIVIPDLEGIERRLSEALDTAEATTDWEPSPPSP